MPFAQVLGNPDSPVNDIEYAGIIMRGPIARLLIVILNIPYWAGALITLAIPFFAAWVALEDGTSPLVTYSGWFVGLWCLWWVTYMAIIPSVRVLQFVFLGHTQPADLFIDAKMDSEEFLELLNRDGYTRQSARDELAATLTEQKSALRKVAWSTIAVYFAIGFAVVFFVSM